MAKVTGGTVVVELSREELGFVIRGLESLVRYGDYKTEDQQARIRDLRMDLEGA
ncbi:hypothetical protein ACWGA9_06245 [Streptomyces sp. NPDC054950]